MFNFLNLFSKKTQLEDNIILTNDSLMEKNSEEYTILYNNGKKSIVGIPDKNLIPGIYKNHLLELILFDKSGNNLSLIKKETNSYTNIDTQVFIIKNVNQVIPYTSGKIVFSIKPYNIVITDNIIQHQLHFTFKLNINPPEKSYIAIEEGNRKLLLYIKVIDNIYSIKELEYHISIH